MGICPATRHWHSEFSIELIDGLAYGMIEITVSANIFEAHVHLKSQHQDIKT